MSADLPPLDPGALAVLNLVKASGRPPYHTMDPLEARDLPPAPQGETHDGWVDELRLRYPRRDAFWSRYRELDRPASTT